MEESDPMATESRGRLENGEREADSVQAAPMKNFPKRDVPLQVKKETEELWEAQLQTFLKTMDPPHSGANPPQFLEPMFEEDTKEFQTSINEITNQWPRREWASEHLLREASQPNGDLDSSMNMEKLVSEDAVSSEVRRQRFRLFCYEAVKGPREVCKQLWNLGHQWLKPKRCSKDQILEALILEQFLTVLPREMQSWVMERSPDFCSQAVGMAEDFLQRLEEPEKWGKEVKKETEEQCWEAQLQKFLKTMDPPHSGASPPQFLEPMFEEDTKEIQASINEITNQWPRREWPPRPPLWASDDLREASQPDGGLNSSMNMEKLVSEDAVSSEVRRQRFRQFCYEAVKGPREVCKQLWKLCHQWLKPERCSKDQILEVLILEQFLTVLPREMQNWVMEQSPENCSQAVGMAEDFLQRLEEPEKWVKEEPKMVLESFASTPKSEQEPHDPIQAQLSVEAKQEGDEESNFFDIGQVQGSEEESSHLQKDDQVAICEIFLQSLETELIPGSPPVPEVHWENHPVEVNKHEEGPDLHSNSFSKEIIHFNVNKEQINDKNFKDLNSQVEEAIEKPYKCFYCGKTSTCKTNFVAHERTHTGEKPYTCLDCGKCFNRKSTLVRHKRIHTGEKPYWCAECGSRFTARCNLINHERIHTGEKPYSCSDCGQSFSRRLQFVIHRRTHTGETPYKCTQCGKCFTRRSSLLIHERIHTNKPNTCTDCGKSFSQKRKLLKHRKIHTAERPYKCPSCDKRFLKRCDLRRHGKKHIVVVAQPVPELSEELEVGAIQLVIVPDLDFVMVPAPASASGPETPMQVELEETPVPGQPEWQLEPHSLKESRLGLPLPDGHSSVDSSGDKADELLDRKKAIDQQRREREGFRRSQRLLLRKNNEQTSHGKRP